MAYPYCYLGSTCQLKPFFTMKCPKQPALACPIGSNLLHQVMRVVSYRGIPMAIETASKVGTFCIIILLIVALAAAGAIQSK
jgi:hypothetical protein